MNAHAVFPELLRATEAALKLSPEAFAELLRVAPPTLE
jgi:hypothetical protein